MKLLEALELLRQPTAPDAAPFRVFLGCGFTPLYLQTYLHAHLKQRLPGRKVEVKTGVFGDLAGSLERTVADANAGFHACVVAVEWSDLDPRLGYRSAGGWRVASLPDIHKTLTRSLDRLRMAIEQVAARVPVVISTPAGPAAPVSFAPPETADLLFWEMESAIASWALGLAANERVRILNPRWLDRASAPSARADYKSDLATGFPYQVDHADVLASGLASLVAPAVPAKALITDLDDTFWLGLVGEVGVEGVYWTLDNKAQVHGLYQQMLQSLVDSGVLVGVASKNDPDLVAQAFQRNDLLVDASALFPIHVNWGPKSKSVEKILEAWNIGADSVVFVDDSPMEVAEVTAAHPQIHGIVFPKNDPAAVVALLGDLRRRFGKNTITAEDALRAQSLRRKAGAEDSDAPPAGGSGLDDFLQSANAVIRIDCTNPPRDGRALELVNKTNQFNLNGARYTEAEWQAQLEQPGALLSVISYEDRFGPLGRIAVFSGVVAGGVLTLHTWVMSCRAFSRRIEHACLKYLFEQPGIERIAFRFTPTPRNGPLQEFLREILGEDATADCAITREEYLNRCPALFHKLVEEASAACFATGSK